MIEFPAIQQNETLNLDIKIAPYSEIKSSYI